ncbi:hypothetical protein ALC53_11763 [Atta colombica]|uniref:Uncharacterized protein n=1 Tax=Atta colombica TaxID=520822 RepID=A0A195B0D0_9HYME|nr:hypothetical protein ALC53_11763 [Atta colombica]
MERVWRRVQGAGRRGAAARCGCPVQPCQLHVDQRAKRGGGGRKSRSSSGGGPQTIVCGCQVQPCPVHPVLIRVRRTRPAGASAAAAAAAAAAATVSCDCPPESQPCPHVQRGSVLRRIRRCECADRFCRHATCGAGTRRRAATQSSSSPISSTQLQLQQQQQQQPCECADERSSCAHTGGGEAPCECECGEEAKPCSHTVKTRRTRRTCTDCNCNGTQPCGHKPQPEGRIKRVKCRVRRAGCAMARCTAELAMLHLHWELATECAPCRPRALTRRLCRRQQSDNELYRSNSFKFERFERTKDECVTPLRKQVNKIKIFAIDGVKYTKVWELLERL